MMRLWPMLVLFACGGPNSATGPTPVVVVAPSASTPAAPTLHDLPISDVPLSELHPEAERAWQAAAEIRDDRLATGSVRDEVEHRQFLRDVLGPWLVRRRERTAALRARLDPLLGAPDPRVRLFAAVVLASVDESTVLAVRAVEPPQSIARIERAVVEYRATLDRSLGSIAAQSRDRWQACVVAARAAPGGARAWVPVCQRHARDMEPIAAAATQTDDGGPARARATPELPAECRIDERWEHIEAPTPNLRARPAIAVIDGMDPDGPEPRFSAEQRQRLLDAVTASLPRAVRGRRVIPRDEMRRAEALHRARRLAPDAPVCGQAPPLPTILARRHRHLWLASIEPLCLFTDGGSRRCLLQVGYRRAGSTDRTGLPDEISIDVPGGETGAIEPWLRAAASIGRAPPSSLGLMGMLTGRGEGSRFEVRQAADDDPWLRVGPTVNDARESLSACLVGRGVASLGVRFTVSPTGDPSDVHVEPRSIEDVARPDALLQCVAEAIGGLAFPCTPSARPTQVEVLVCVAR